MAIPINPLFQDLSAGEVPPKVALGPGTIDCLPGIPSHVRTWLHERNATGELELLANHLAATRVVASAEDAPSYLARHLARERHDGAIMFGDLQGAPSAKLAKFLKHRNGDPVHGGDDSMSALQCYRMFGSAGHRFAEFLYGGSFSVGDGQAADAPFVRQGSLFDHAAPAGTLFECAPFPSHSTRMVSREEWQALEELSSTLAPLVSEGHFLKDYFGRIRELEEFDRIFTHLFPEQFSGLPQGGPETPFLRFLSLMGWMGIMRMRLEEGSSAIYFPEFPTLPYSFGVQAGRIDRLDVFPNGSAGALRGIRRDSFKSAIDLVRGLRTFHSHVRFRVVDWKFAVGDYLDHIITTNTPLPLPNHVKQVQWYLLWLALGEYLSRGMHEGWPSTDHLSGELRYILPSGQIVRIPVEPDAGALREQFREQVVDKWHLIARRHIHRVLSNRTVRVLSGEVSKDASPEPVSSPKQLILTAEAAGADAFGAYLDTFRTFVGRGRFIEEIKTEKGVQQRFHLARFARALERKAVKTEPNFSWRRGGKIICPLHSEKTGSFNLNFEKGLWHCFGCGAGGTFEKAGLSEEILNALPVVQNTGRPAKTVEELSFSDRRRQLMADAHALLTAGFRGSIAESYLCGKRGIDFDLAEEVGAGWGTLDLVNDLLDAGYSLEELESGGFVRFSERVRPGQDLERILVRRGFASDSIVRPETVFGSNLRLQDVVKRPFPALSGFVTFPLELPIRGETVITGFYGRNAMGVRPGKKEFKHTYVTFPDVPNGIFGYRRVAAWVADGGVETIFVSEAAIDTLTLRMLRCYEVPISIGTRVNHFIEQLLVQLNPCEINGALDFDIHGREGLEALAKDLSELGYQGEFVNFSMSFFAHHPEILREGYKDWNEWWTKSGSARSRPFSRPS